MGKMKNQRWKQHTAPIKPLPKAVPKVGNVMGMEPMEADIKSSRAPSRVSHLHFLVEHFLLSEIPVVLRNTVTPL